MKTTLRNILGLAIAAIPFAIFAQTPQLVPLATFGSNGDGSIRPNERSYITGTNSFQRGMAFNPTTGNLIIANRSPISAPTVNIVNGTNGADVGVVPFGIMFEGGNVSFPINKVGVAEDGAIYVANLTTTSTGAIEYSLYRATNETSALENVFFGDPSNGAANSSQSSGRWGDTMVVRGSGTNTQILIASAGTLAAVLRPTSETMSAFTATTLTTTLSSGAIADSISFGDGDTFWGKSAAAGTLRRLSFDLTTGTATLLNTYPSSGFPTRVGPIHHLISSNLFAGIEIVPGPDLVKLYDVSNLAANPVFLDHALYATNLPNAIGAGTVCSGNGKLYTLDADNGVMAFNIEMSADPVPPTFFVNPVGGVFAVGTNITLTAIADGVAAPTYQWYFNQTNAILDATNTTHTLLNAQTTNSGTYTAIAVNNAGAATTTVTVTVLPASVLYLYEPFNYTPGQQLVGTTLAPGQTWYINGAGDDSRIASGSLDVSGLASSFGNSFTNGGGGGAARIPMGVPQNSGSIYASFAMRMNSIGTTFAGNGLLTAFVNDPANDQVCRMYVTNTGAGYKIGATKLTSGASIVFDPTVFQEGQTVFVVMRYTWNSGSTTNDEVSMWLNPAPNTFGNATAPTPTITANLSGTDVAAINGIAFRQNSTANTPQNINYDELRIANKWELVTPVATVVVPISLTIQKSGGSVVISWPTSGSAGFNLQTASSLSAPIGWSNVAEPVVVQGANNTVTLGASGAGAFYRLLK